MGGSSIMYGEAALIPAQRGKVRFHSAQSGLGRSISLSLRGSFSDFFVLGLLHEARRLICVFPLSASGP